MSFSFGYTLVIKQVQEKYQILKMEMVQGLVKTAMVQWTQLEEGVLELAQDLVMDKDRALVQVQALVKEMALQGNKLQA